ncbi:MAG: lipase chaperone [Burkholderiales bacterium]|nr:lipase chaperone [Burkholderiales bacterium]
MSTYKKPALILAVTTVLASSLIFFLQRPAPVAAPSANPEQNLFPFVRSLEGTRSDGDLKVATDDSLIVDAELGRMFDYYLSAIGEKSLDAIRAEAERELDRKLKPNAAKQAKRLLGQYLDYKRALVDIEKDQKLAGSTAAIVRARLAAMQKVRAQFFTPQEAQGLFGFSDAYDMDAVARLEVADDKTLNDTQKKEKLAAIDAAMSPQLREEREAPLRIVKAEETVKAMRAQGATEQDVYRYRASTFSPEAAARLAEVDKEEAEWKARIAQYLGERKKIQAEMAQQPEATREAALQQLRLARFSAEEQSRLVAYE